MQILIIDIETTDFQQKGGKIVEVGIVSLDLNTGEKQILFDSVCHELPITLKEVSESWIVKNSDLTIDQIRHSVQFKEIAPKIQQIINDYPGGSTAYNNAFDFCFLESRGIVFPKKLACPMKLSTDICKIPGRNGFKWPSVMEAWKHFFGDTGYDEKHRGADDAWHEADIVYELFKMGVFIC